MQTAQKAHRQEPTSPLKVKVVLVEQTAALVLAVLMVAVVVLAGNRVAAAAVVVLRRQEMLADAVLYVLFIAVAAHAAPRLSLLQT